MKIKILIPYNVISGLRVRLVARDLFKLAIFLLVYLLCVSVHAQNCSIILKIKDPAPVCSPITIDLTSSGITEGSTKGLIFSYYMNSELTMIVPSPAKVSAGTYYIKGVLTGSCQGFVVASVKVTGFDKPHVIIPNSVIKSVNGRADLTSPLITSGSDAGLVFSYWYDAATSKPLISPKSTVNGVYFIKGTSDNGCFDVQSITINN